MPDAPTTEPASPPDRANLHRRLRILAWGLFAVGWVACIGYYVTANWNLRSARQSQVLQYVQSSMGGQPNVTLPPPPPDLARMVRPFKWAFAVFVAWAWVPWCAAFILACLRRYWLWAAELALATVIVYVTIGMLWHYSPAFSNSLDPLDWSVDPPVSIFLAVFVILPISLILVLRAVSARPLEPSPQPPGFADVPHANGGPDWDRIAEHVYCPFCGYNLRGLSDPRCPECGRRSVWEELFDPTRQKHPFLFEHHPEANFSSFFRTLRASLRPRHFWQSLHPAMPANMLRLLIYLLAVAAMMILMAFAGACAYAYCMKNNLAGWMGQPTLFRAEELRGSWPYYTLWGLFNWSMVETGTLCVRWAFAVGGWLFLTAALLQIFQISAKRRRLLPSHLLRCVVYSFDLVFWASLILLVVLPAAILLDYYDTPVTALLVSLPILWTLLSWRLYVAVRDYLRFDHPLGTVLAVQTIVALVAALTGILVR
jgi:hypothetical protein